MRSPNHPRPVLEPVKYDPNNPDGRVAAVEEAMSKYQSVAWQNPFSSPNAFQDLWNDQDNGQYQYAPSPMAMLENCASPKFKKVWVQSPQEIHPALRQTSHTGTVHHDTWKDRSDYSPTRRQHVEFQDHHSPPTSQKWPRSPAKNGYGLSKSYSDSTFYTSGYSSSRTNSGLIPPPLILSPARKAFPVIREHEDMTTNRKVSIKESEDGFKMVNCSPRKQLFGEKGLLGRTYSAKDPGETSPRKAGFSHWSGKLKQRIGDMSRDISGKVAAFEAAQRRSPWAGNSTFPITLSAYAQGELYMQLELLLSTEVNEFLLTEARENRISVSSVKAAAEQWRNKGRPQVLGFSYDLKTQRELVAANVDSVRFAKTAAFSRVRALSVLASWKMLAQEMSVRTFCQPDSAIKKHFHDAETVLEFINARPDSMITFQDLKSRVVTEIYLRGRAQVERKVVQGDAAPWSVPRGLRS